MALFEVKGETGVYENPGLGGYASVMMDEGYVILSATAMAQGNSKPIKLQYIGITGLGLESELRIYHSDEAPIGAQCYWQAVVMGVDQ